jgi:hypothetical protein
MWAHEIFHHLGLVDEYAEFGPGYIYADESQFNPVGTSMQANCRATGPKDSIMSWYDQALFKIKKGDPLLYPAEFRTIVFPGCRAKNAVFYDCAQYSTWQAGAIHPRSCTVGRPAACSHESTDWVTK